MSTITTAAPTQSIQRATGHLGSPSMTVYSGDTLLQGLEQWQQLEDEVGFQNWSCSADWVAAFVDHYSGVIPIECVVVQSAGQVVGAGLLCRKRLSVLGPLGFHALLNGTGGEPDGDPFAAEQHQLICRPENYAFVEQVITNYALGRPGVDAVYWSGYSHRHVAALLQRERRCELTERRAPAIDLTRIDRSPAQEATWIENTDEAANALTSLVEWSLPAWGVSEPTPTTNRYTRFLLDVTTRLLDSGDAAVVATANATIVLFFGAETENHVFAYADAATDGPSLTAAHRAAARLAAERGFTRYDMPVLASDAARAASNTKVTTAWVRIPHPTWRSRLVFTLSRLKQLVRRR